MKQKILIIDDTRVIRDFLSEVLIDDGFEVDIAENGLIGLEKATQNNYLMIFCDVHMPVMNGLVTVKKIKEIKPDIAIIMTDSFPGKLANQAAEAGALCCLSKPFSLDELRETINKIIKNVKILQSD